MITLFRSKKNKRERDVGRPALKIRSGWINPKVQIYHLSLMEARMMLSQLKAWKKKGVI